jgi:hypothetical protein
MDISFTRIIPAENEKEYEKSKIECLAGSPGI